MFGSADQSAAAGNVMDIIDLLLPESFFLDRFRMAAWLPAAAQPVRSGLLTQGLRETAGELFLTVIAQLPPCELAKIGERPHQPFGIEVAIKHDQVQVRRHNDEGVDAQVLLAVTKGQAIRDDFAGGLADENGQPLHDRVSDEIDSGFRMNTVALHGGNCRPQLEKRQRRKALLWVAEEETFGRRPWHGQETVPQRATW